MRERQVPCATPGRAQGLCAARLVCENDFEFMNSSKLPDDVSRALLRNKSGALAMREVCQAISAGFWMERYGGLNDACRGVAPWFDSLFDPADPRQVQQLPKENTMSNPAPIKIETRVFIDGVPASGLTVDQLHQKVREQEAHIKDLEKIENKSKKLAAEIDKRKASIQALNDYIDGLPD